MPRQEIVGKPGIIWRVLGDTPRQGLDCIIDKLKRRYNPFMTNEDFMLHVPGYIPELQPKTRTELEVQKKNKKGAYEDYGNIAIIYGGITTDETTSEHKTAQLFWVYFNMGDRTKSYPERDYFLKSQDNN